MIRFISYDWGVEREPRFGIDRLDVAPNRPRLSAQELARRFDELPTMIGNAATMLVRQVEALRNDGHINKLKTVDFSQMTGLARQSYYEGRTTSKAMKRCTSRSSSPSNAAIGRSFSPTKYTRLPTGTTIRAV